MSPRKQTDSRDGAFVGCVIIFVVFIIGIVLGIAVHHRTDREDKHVHPASQTEQTPDQASDQELTSSQGTYDPEARKREESLKEYEVLLRKRLQLQKSIMDAMDAYRTVSLRVHETTTKLAQLAGDTPLHELAQMRSKGEQIPLNLRPAFSLMEAELVPDKGYLQLISQRLNDALNGVQLTQLDRSIRLKENEIQFGGILSAGEQEEIQRALNQEVVNVGPVGDYEEKQEEDEQWKKLEDPSAWE